MAPLPPWQRNEKHGSASGICGSVIVNGAKISKNIGGVA